MQQYISIPKPCNENWDAMTPREQGRHCAKCDLIVKDFSDMPTEEIIQFINKKEGRVCGSFRIKETPPLTDKLKKFIYALALVFLPFIPLSGHGQSNTSPQIEHTKAEGSIQGRLTDANNEAIPFVQITLTQNGIIKKQVKSNFEGVFVLNHLQPGLYDLKASSVSYKKFSRKNIEVSAKQATNLKTLTMKRNNKILNKIVIRSQYRYGERRHGGACVITDDPKKDINKTINPYRAGRQFVTPEEIRDLPGGYR